MWRLHTDDTIRPRFGFAAVDTSSCVCNRHHHYVYWCFVFDLRTPGNNDNRDVVIWYVGHVTHDVTHEEPGEFGHIYGPDLKRVKW